jgi:hypothetical protein
MHCKGLYSIEIPSSCSKDENYFRGFSVEHIDRSKNAEADELAKAVARKIALPPNVFFQTLKRFV